MSDNTHDEDLTGLKNKVNELLAANKAANARAEKAEREREEAAEAAANASATDLQKAVSRAEKAEKAFKDAEDRAALYQADLRNQRADSEVAQALAAANVDAKHITLLTKALRSDVKFTDEGMAMIEGKAVADYAKSFFAKDGLSYVRAPDNGGGAVTGHDGTKTPRMTKENFSFGEFAKIQLADPAEANAIADSIGRPELKTSL